MMAAFYLLDPVNLYLYAMPYARAPDLGGHPAGQRTGHSPARPTRRPHTVANAG